MSDIKLTSVEKVDALLKGAQLDIDAALALLEKVRVEDSTSRGLDDLDNGNQLALFDIDDEEWK